MTRVQMIAGALVVVSREEWERSFGPLPAAFAGDRVYLDDRLAAEDPRPAAWRVTQETITPQGIPIGECNLEDLRLAMRIQRMYRTRVDVAGSPCTAVGPPL